VIPAFHRAIFLPPRAGDIKAKRPSVAAITRFLSLVATPAHPHPEVVNSRTMPNRKTSSVRHVIPAFRATCAAAGIDTAICNHTFRGTGIATYLENSGILENAQKMAAHASTRATQLYDRRRDDVTLDDIVKIDIER